MEQDNRIDNPTTENLKPINERFETEFAVPVTDEIPTESYQDIPEEVTPEVDPEEGETTEETSQETPKKKSKKKRKKRKKNPNWLARIFIFLAILAVIYALLHVEYFKVTEINVTGNDYLTAEQVLKDSKVKKGNNIFDVYGFIEENKICKNPYVESVRIHKDLPNTINVEVTEPVGMAQFAMGDKFVVTDNEGKVLQVAKEQQRIVLVEGIEVKDAVVGSPAVFNSDQAKVCKQAMELVKATAENDMFFKKINIENGRVTAYIYNKLKVKGTVINVIDSLESGTLRTVAYNLYQKGTTKGTIIVSADNYCSFTTK